MSKLSFFPRIFFISKKGRFLCDLLTKFAFFMRLFDKIGVFYIIFWQNLRFTAIFWQKLQFSTIFWWYLHFTRDFLTTVPFFREIFRWKSLFFSTLLRFTFIMLSFNEIVFCQRLTKWIFPSTICRNSLKEGVKLKNVGKKQDFFFIYRNYRSAVRFVKIKW